MSLALGAAGRRRYAGSGDAQGQVGGDSLTLARGSTAGSTTAQPRVTAALATARAAQARIDPARRPPDPVLQFGTLNRQLPGFGLDEVLGMNQIQLTQMIPLAGQLGLAGQVERAKTAAADARAREVWLEDRERAAMAFFELGRPIIRSRRRRTPDVCCGIS